MVTTNRITEGSSYKYTWGDNYLKVASTNEKIEAATDSPERWITEHYWGYTKITSKKTYEYQVKHPIWNLYGVLNHSLSGNMGDLYGQKFGSVFSSSPNSVFIADGSEVTVHMPTVIR